MVKKHFENFEIISDRGLVLQFFEATMNLAHISVLCSFGNHYIMGKNFVLLNYFKVNFFAVFDVSSNNFFLRLLC